MLETFKCTLAGLRLQLAIIGRVSDLSHPPLLLVDFVSYLYHNVLLGHDVLNTDCETRRYKPVIHEELNVR